MKKVMVCPKCKGWSVNRKGGCCIHCNQRVVVGEELVFKGDYYWDKNTDSYFTFAEMKELSGPL